MVACRESEIRDVIFVLRNLHLTLKEFEKEFTNHAGVPRASVALYYIKTNKLVEGIITHVRNETPNSKFPYLVTSIKNLVMKVEGDRFIREFDSPSEPDFNANIPKLSILEEDQFNCQIQPQQ